MTTYKYYWKTVLLFLLLNSNYSFGQIVETFSTPGSFTWTCPANVTQVVVECWGGGGGGGNSNTTTSNGGTGGGGGAYAKKTFTVISGNIYFFNVGLSGIGAPSNSTTSATNGQDSWFNITNQIPTSNNAVLAKGGIKGLNNSVSLPNNGGGIQVQSFGDIVFVGGNGFQGSSTGGGGGGSSASSTGAGISATGISGASGNGGGSGGSGSTSTNGSQGAFPGGGGGGSNDLASNSGGNGGNGLVKLTYFINCSGTPNSASINISSPNGCEGLSTTITATNLSTEPGISIQWQISNDNNTWADISGATSFSYTTIPTSSSYYRIRSVCSFSGLENYSQSVQYIVFPLPTTPIISVSGNTTFCQGDSVLLSTNIVSGLTYQWSNNGVIINGAINNYYYASTSGVYSLSVTNNNGCQEFAQAISISVQPLPVMTSITAKTICSGQAVNIVLTSNLNSSYTWIASPSANINGETTTYQTGTAINDTLNNIGSSNETVAYTVIPISNDGNCVGAIQTVIITVVPSVVMTNITTKTICSGSAVGLVLTSNVTSSYVWVATNNLNVTGESTVNQTTNNINNTLTTPSSTLQNVTYTVTPTSTIGGCFGSPQSIIITVVPSITMTNANAITVCSGTAVNLSLTSNIAGSFSFIATNNPNTTGESTTAQTGSSISDLITNNVTSIQTVTYVLTPTTLIGSCIGSNQTVTVTIIPSVVLTNSTSKTICSGNSVNLALSSNVSSSYIWVASNNSNVSGESITNQSTGTINNVLTNTTSIPEVVNYTVIPTSTTGLCAGSPQTILVSVNPLPVVTNSNALTICSGSNINFTLTSNIPSTFTWVANSNTNVSGESLTTQTGSIINNTLTNNSTTNQNVTYTITPTSLTGLCVGAPQTVTITVIPPVTMTSISSKTICSGQAVNLALTSNISSTYSWTATNNPNTTGESTTAQTGSSISDLITNNVTSIQTVTYVVTPTTLIGFCAGTNQTVTVTIIPSVVLTNSTSKTICSGNSVNLALSSNVSSSYIWVASNNSNVSGESITNQSTGTINNVLTNTTSIPEVVNYTVIPTSTTGLCSGSPQTILVTVNPLPVVTNSNALTICSGSNINFTLTSNIPSTFTWVANSNTNVSGESLTNQSGSIINNTLTNNSTTNQNVTYTITPTSLTGLCVGAPQTVTITVIPPVTMTSISSKTICSGQAVNLALTSNISSTYSWTATNNLNTTGESTTAQTGSSISDLITNNVSSIQTVNYVITPTSLIGSCIGTNQTVTVTIIPSVVLTNSTSQNICSGSSVNLVLSSNVTSSYTWVASNNSNVSGESITNQSTGTINNVLTNTTSIPEIVNYTVIPTSTTGSCAGSPQTISVTVNPLPVVTNSNAITTCSGSTINFPLTTNIPSTFTWVANSNANISGESLTTQTGSIINNTLTNNSTTNQNVIFTITPTSVTGLCVGTPQTVTITVIPPVTMTSISSKTICSGQAVNLALTSNISSTFSWAASDNLNTTGESTTAQTGSSISDLITNNVTSIQTVTYVITPTTLIGSCIGTNQTVTVTIIPSVVLTNSTSQTICSGSSVNLVLSSNVTSSYTWVATNNSNVSGESTTNQSTGTINNVLTNTTSIPEIVNYTVIPTSTTGLCAGSPQTILVTVNSLPIITNSSALTICSGSNINVPLTSTLSSTFTWISNDNSNIQGESTVIQSSSTIVNTLVNTSTTPQIISYSITPTSINNLCVGTPQIITITVNPTPNSNIIITGPTTFCQGGNVVLSVASSTGQTYQWQNNGTNISGATTTSYTATSSGSYSITINNTFGCTSSSNPINVTVSTFPIATIDNQGISLICQGGAVLLSANTGTGLTYQWRNNGTNISGATSSSYSANAAGSYTVIVTNSSGCSTTSNATVLTLNQLTATLYPTNSTMNTGYVTSAGSKTSGNMLVSTSTTYGRGWAKFPLTSIPSGSVITSVTIKFYTYGGTASATSNTIRGFIGDPLTMTGSTLYSTIGNGTVYNTSTWTIGTTTTPSLNTKVLAAAGITYVQNQLTTGYVNFGFVRGTTNLHSIYGSNSTTYSVRLEITYIPPAPSATLSANGSTSFCQGGSIILSTNSVNGNSYQWRNSGNIISGASASSYTASTSGIYTVRVTNTSGCSTISNGSTVTVNPLPTVTLTNAGPVSFCQGASVLLNANSNGTTFQWKKNGVNISGATASTYTVNTSGSYSVFVTNSFGCSNTSNSINVTVYALPNPIISGITSICQGDTSILSINSTSGITYQWRNNGVNINDASNYFYAATSPGSYSVFVINANGCSATSPSVSVTVNQLPTSTISASNATTFCQGGSTNLTADNNIGLSYQWYKNGLPMNGNNSLSYSATTSGNYNVYFTNSNGCSNYSSNSITVTVLSLPNLSISGDSIICQGETTNLTAFSNGTISWNGNLNQNSIQVSPNVSTTYSVSSVGSNGCTIQDQVLVIVNYPSDTTIYTSSYGPFELNGQIYQASGIYSQNLQTVAGCDSTITINLNYITNSIENLTDQNIVIYPNPSIDGVFHINNEFLKPITQIKLFNALGMNVLIQKSGNIIDLINFENGIYWIEITFEGGYYLEKLIKG